MKDNIKIFNSETVSDLDLNTYQSSLQNIGKKLKVFEDNINVILVNLEEDYPRNNDLDIKKVELSDEVRRNENKVNSKMKEIEESQPSFIAKKENLELPEQKIIDANKREEEAKVKRDKILKIKMEYLNSNIKDLTTDLTAVKKAKLLSDNKVRHTLSNLSQWELSLEEIKENKVEIDKDAVKATVDKEEIVKLKSFFNKLCSIF